MKTARLMVCVLSALVTVSAPAMADWHSGRITTQHFNARAEYNDRGVCFEMVPAVAGKWVCLYKDNSLYTEMTHMLRDAYIEGKTCTVEFSNANPKRFHEILFLECT